MQNNHKPNYYHTKQVCFVILFCLTQLQVFAQYQIRVSDSKTKEPVTGANIYFPDTKTGTITDENGIFQVDSRQTSLLVQISFIGYKTLLETLKLSKNDLNIFIEPSFHNLQEIIVSGNTSRLQSENVVNVENVSLNNNQLLQGVSLVQKIANIAGVSNLSTGVGIGKPVIRGLSGNRIAVFSQGIRVENQQWGDEHGLGLDELGYEQVEVIKGPASLLYGSDALGGVLYFAGERYARENTIEALAASEYNTNTEGWRNTAAFKVSKGKIHWNLFGGRTTHKDYRDGNCQTVDNSRFHTTDIKSSLGYSIHKFSTSLRYNYLNEQYGLLETGDENSVHTQGRQPDFPFQKLSTHLLNSENAYFFDNGSKLKIDMGYVFNNRKEFEEKNVENTAALDMNLNTLSCNAKWISAETQKRWQWITGVQTMYQTNHNRGEELLIPNALTSDAGVYATADYHYAQNSYWQGGARFDSRRISGKYSENEDATSFIPAFSATYTAFNFSTGVFQQIDSHFSLRSSLSSGFRAPNMFELLSNGVHEGTNRYEIGNRSLRTENSYQADCSFDYQTEHWRIFINPYFNYIHNYIYLKPTGEREENLPVYNYMQSSARLFGGEAGFHWHPHPLDWLHLQADYSITRAQDTDKNNLPLTPAPKINAIVNANFTPDGLIKKFSAFWQYLYSFTQNRIAKYETPTPAYWLVNMGVHFDFRYWQVSAVVNNLFDAKYFDHLSRYKSEGIYNMGRNVSIKVTIHVN